MTTTIERPAIIKTRNGSDKLVIMTNGGSVIGLGIIGFRSGLAQIEASNRELAASTIARRDVLRSGIEMWEARK